MIRFVRCAIVALTVSLAMRAAESPAGLEIEKPKYAERWALVIGINYESIPPEHGLKLLRAEDDAEKFYSLLKNNYGFTDEEKVFHLTGDKAKKVEIEDKIEDICNGAAADACVIVYFSGHGFTRPTSDANASSAHGELLAADVKYADNLPRASTVVEMKTLCERLEKCKARHKLLILDCCHSGLVFSFGRNATAFDAQRVDDAVFRDPGFQAMTASRGSQLASDGNNGSENSPFTDALLQALKYIPATQNEGKPFTTTELFTGMQWYLDRNLKDGQSPRCSWLDGGQGELHFFPEGKFPKLQDPDDREQKVMLAMVPGSFDQWWFDETPWFMPGLRYEVVDIEELKRSSTLEIISPLRLEQAAIETRNKLAADKREEVQRRLADFDKLFRAKDDESTWDATVDEVREGLKALVDKHIDKSTATSGSKIRVPTLEEDLTAKVDPVDLHFLAVLEHASREKDVEKHKAIQAGAKDHYARAIALYEDQAAHSRASKPLLALCLADRGLYANVVDRKYEEACEYFKVARSVFGSLTPPPFQVYVLCREAEALAKLGRRGEAKKRLEEAFAAAKIADPGENSSLTAALLHRRAWLKMEWCEFSEAIGDFNESTRKLEEFAETDHEAAIMCMHNAHGVAMATRYQGDSEKALSMYRNLLQDKIYKRLGLMREHIGRESNYRQIKARLIERWVNAMERAGDCSLFGAPMDLAEAIDDYRRALRAANYLSPDKSLGWQRKLRQKLALALVLPNSGAQDLDRAADQLDEIDAITAQMPTNLQDFDTIHEIRDKLIRLLLNHCRSLTPCGTGTPTQVAEKAPKPAAPIAAVSAKDDASTEALTLSQELEDGCVDRGQVEKDLLSLRTLLTKLARENFLDSSLARDDIETAMFAMRVILEDLPDPILRSDVTGKDRVMRHKDVELLLEYCRLGRRGGPGAIYFVRPYYDSAIAALIDLKPKDSKQLVEVAWEATRGKLHFKPQTNQTTLLLYCGKKGNYFLLDVPHATSAYYSVDPSVNLDRMRAVSSGEDTQQLNLPADLRKELFAMDGKLGLCWRDQVRGLGIDSGQEVTVSKAEDSIGASVAATVEQRSSQAAKFPFELPSSLQVVDVSLEVQPTFARESDAEGDDATATEAAENQVPAAENNDTDKASTTNEADTPDEPASNPAK